MPKLKGTRLTLRVMRFLALLLAAIIVTGWVMQRRMLYHPQKITLEEGTRIAKEKSFEPWQNSAGQFIGWKQTSKTITKHGVLLIVHGNAGSAIDRIDYAEDLAALYPMDVYVLEYPGYGARSGSPSQKSFFDAANEAVGLLKDQGPIHLWGESIGTGVAAYVAGAHPDAVRAVVLFAPYHNLTDVAQYHMPFLPVRWILRDTYPAASYLKNYRGSVAVFLAGNDEIIPNRFGRALYDAYNGPKRVWEVSEATHNDLSEQPLTRWMELVTFWKQGVKGGAQ